MKRFFDVAVSLCGLLLAAPLLLGIFVALRITLGSPVFFRQRRPGLYGRPFIMTKFRTMRDDRGPDGRLLADEQRATRLGTWLRRASLDELPELFNVLRGDMSLVGPRPLLMAYLEQYTPDQHRRHDVRPGITGWAQVNGRNDLSWDEKLAMDLWYVDHASLSLDMRIIGLTMATVFRRKGISASEKCLPGALVGKFIPLDECCPE